MASIPVALRLTWAPADSRADYGSEPLTAAKLGANEVAVFAESPAYEQRAGGATWAFRKGTSEIAVIVNGRVRVSAAEGDREGVLAGLGISIGGSEWLFAPELKSGAVQVVLTDWLLPPVDLWAVFPTGRQASAKARALRAWS